MTDSTIEPYPTGPDPLHAPRRTALDALESDAISALRDIAGDYERPVLPRTADRASKVLLRLAEKAFWPTRGPIAIVGAYDVAQRRPDFVVTPETLLARWTEVDVRRYLAREGLDPRRATEEPAESDGELVPDDAAGRLPVQYVTRPTGGDYRGYSGQVSSGTFRVGDEVVVLPSRRRTTLAAIDTYDGDLDTAVPGQSVTLRLADEVDISRGDVIARADDTAELLRRDARPLRVVPPTLSHLDLLEAASIHIMREVAAEFERPALLFSGGKDSIVMLRLAEKAFSPARLPFPLLHVDTGHNFPEVLDVRDRRSAELRATLHVACVQESIDRGRVRESGGPTGSRNRLQTTTLLDAIAAHRFDAVFGGARRDEEKARAKERVFSFRDEFGQWDPKQQRPEPWALYNGRHRPGEHIRVFPLSDWTELDIWRYIAREGIELPSIYFAHEREVVERDGMLVAVSEHTPLLPGETSSVRSVRFRTVGDITCTGAVESTAATVAEVVHEVTTTRITERGASRADDRVSEAAMEDRKREGYF